MYLLYNIFPWSYSAPLFKIALATAAASPNWKTKEHLEYGHSQLHDYLWRQTADLGANQDEVLGEISSHEGPGLVTDTDDLGVGRSLGGHLVHVGPDGLADGGVDTTSQASVRGDGHVQVLRLLLVTAHLGGAGNVTVV